MGQPNLLVPIALAAFLAVVLACFALLDPRRTTLATILGGWLFLPQFDSRYTFITLHTKAAFVPAVVLLGSLAFDTASWRRFRLRLLDLPIVFLCVTPFATALHNDLGAYEASSAAFEAAMEWGAPYLLGRLYLGSPRALREFATALVVAALVYVPFCLWEVKFSPRLHESLYGFRTTTFETLERFGGWRPDVFMRSGLAVGMFMTVGTLSGVWLWRTGAKEKIAGVPLAWVCAVLAATAVLVKATGAIILLALGLFVLEATRRFRTPVLILALAVAPFAFCAARISGWDAEVMARLTERAINQERARSIQFRIDNEDRLIQRAMARPWLGWGRFGRSFVYEESGRMVIIDSMWIVALGFTGLLGLASLGAVLALPALALLWNFPARHLGDAYLAPAIVCAMGLLLWAFDNLLNAMMAPMYPALAGALTSFVLTTRSAASRQPRGVESSRRKPAVERPSWT